MEDEIYKKVIEIVENCMFEMGYIMRPHADETDDFLTELEKDLNEKLPLPSVSREKADLKGLIEFAKERLNPDKALDYNNDDKVVYAYNSKQITIGDLKKLLEFASHEPEAPAPSNHKTYYCSVCHKVPVDAENGFDTCSDCVSKI